MNLRDLDYLVAVADLRSFSQAAVRCHISQPTLSNQIRKLEEQLGVRLFERSNRKVLPTEAGEQIVLAARRVLREVETIRDIADHAQDPFAGRFRLGAFPTLSSYIFPQLVPAIRAEMPNLKLILVEDKTAALTDALLKGELDAALLALPVHDDNLLSQPLFDDKFYVAVAADHPLAQLDSIDQSRLLGQKLLLLEEGHCLRNHALDICHRIGASEEQDVRATGLETLRQMVKAGTGITFMPEIAINSEEQGIRYIPIKPPCPTRRIGVVWRKTSSRGVMIEKLAQLIKHSHHG